MSDAPLTEHEQLLAYGERLFCVEDAALQEIRALHQREQLRDHTLLHLALDFGPLGRDGVDLVEEDDAGRARLRFLEDLP